MRLTSNERSKNSRRSSQNTHHGTEVLTLLYSLGCPISDESAKSAGTSMTLLDGLASELYSIPQEVFIWLINHGIKITSRGIKRACYTIYNQMNSSRESAAMPYQNSVIDHLIHLYGSVESLPEEFNKWKLYLAILTNELNYLKKALPLFDWRNLPIDRFSPLHFAACLGRTDIVRLLIEQCGQNPLQPDTIEGELPLHKACIAGHVDVVRYFLTLMKSGKQVGINRENQWGWKPLEICQGNAEIVNMLEQHGAESDGMDYEDTEFTDYDSEESD